MVDAKHLSSPFFVGIGGSGMMPLAMILAGRGAQVSGSDRSLDQGRVPAKFDDLRVKGVQLFPQDGSGITSADQLVVASAAVEGHVPDMVRAAELGCPRATRAELLAHLFNDSELPIGVAGTSGKSTVTGMIGWILHARGRDPTVMNGAVMKNFARADAPFASALVGHGDAFVSEVDESDGSIALYRPAVAVLNNISLDHKGLDELRQLFGDFARQARTTVANIGDEETATLAATLPREHLLTVAINADADLVASALAPEPFAISFALASDTEHHRVHLQVPGRHNVANALAAIGACVAAGVPLADAARAIQGFTGLRRRFDLVGSAGGISVLDDFGHNPDKIAATLSTLHAFPGRLLLLFQPHGYGPLKVMRRELVDSLAQHMGPGDVLVLPDPVYFGGTVAREVTSADISEDLRALGRDVRHIADRADAAAALVDMAEAGDRIVIMGARDDTLSLLATDMLESIRAKVES